MKIGTKSLLFGIHQVFWHPYVVYKAWKYLYGHPTWKELVCIFIHDWGYWGRANLDGDEGIMHPQLGATIAYKLFGTEYFDLCIGHSRSFVEKTHNIFKVSKLCWADKLSFIFEPRWFYLLRSKLSGELMEARLLSRETAQCPLVASNKEWFETMLEYFRNSIPQEILDRAQERTLI
jgi:hypothetical protein